MTKPYKIVAKAIIFDNQDRVLIMRKSKEEREEKASHGYDFPGGGLEREESLMQGLKREVFEETGLQVEVLAPAYVFDERKKDKHLVIIKFACHRPTGDFVISEEHDNYEWVSLEQLPLKEYPDWMKEEVERAYRVYQEFRS